MLNISVEISTLSKNQREALAGFILTFPQSKEAEPYLPFPPQQVNPSPAELEKFATEGTDAVQAPRCSRCSSILADGICQNYGCETPQSPTAAFGPSVTNAIPIPPAVVMTNGIVSTAGPHLVIPPPLPAPPEGLALDSSGLPWNERIHASSRATVADGTWRKKRGVDDATVAQVEAELRALMNLPTPAINVPLPPAPEQLPPVATIIPPIPASVPAPPVASAPSTDPRQAFVELVGKVSAAIPAKLSREEVEKACLQVGVPSLPLLANRMDLLPQVAAIIEGIIASRS